jgi:hypothetical protein
VRHGYHRAATPARPRWRFPLRVPCLLVWLLFLPFALLLAPLVFAACLVMRTNPFRGVGACWQVFSALRGVRITVDDPGAPISIQVF